MKIPEIDYEIDKETGCWNCISHALGSGGYPMVKRSGIKYTAHRWIWKKYVEADIGGYEIHHKCENKKCINPDHLEKLSPGDHNVKHPPRKGLKFKLSEDDVIDIFKNNYLTQAELAEKYGVGQSNINMIKNRKRWTHITKNL